MLRHVVALMVLGLALPAAAPATAQTTSRPPSVAASPALPTPASSAGAISCPGDKVVWVNTRSGIYHFQGERWFGNTQQGKYLCEHEADREGDRPTHNGQ